MNIQKSAEVAATPRRILRNVSNVAIPSGVPSLDYQGNTRLPTQARSLAALRNTSARRGVGPDVFITHRQPSKTYGDLKKIRPISPPCASHVTAAGGIQSPRGDYVDSTRNLHSQNCNRSGRGNIEKPSPIHGCRKAFASPASCQCEGLLNALKSPETLVYGLHSPSSTFVRRHANATSPRRSFETHRIHLHGYIEYDYTSALEFYRPIAQSYPTAGLKQPANGAGLGYLRTARLIEHLDVCTVLKGLSLADAEIMLSIDKIFRPSLEDLLASQLQQMEWEARQELSLYHVDNSDRKAGAMATRQLGFRLNELVRIMLKKVHPESHGWDEMWCQSSLLMHVLQYLTTRECLVDIEPREYNDMAIQIRMHYAGVPRPIAEVIRNPDFLCFEQLDPLPREGQPFRVIPRYRHGAFDGAEDVNATIEYFIEPAMPWLTWKPELGGFVGTVPLFSEMASGTVPDTSSVLHMGSVGNYTDVHCLRFEVKAVLKENFVTATRLERTVRARLNIKIIPWYAHSSALAPKGSLFNSLVIDQNVAAILSPKAKEGALTSRVQKATSNGAPRSSIPAGPCNKHISAPTALEDREFSIVQNRYSPWPTSDLSNYDVSSIFAEHKPYHKSNLIPGSPRKHVDEIFGLTMPEDVDFGRGAVTDVQAYHVTGLDSIWRHHPEFFWRSGRTESELAEIPTTQNSEDLANVANDSQNSIQPLPVEESEVREVVKPSDDCGGHLDTQPVSEQSLELAPTGVTTTYTSIGRNHNGNRARRSFPTYDEEAGRQESLHFPRSEMRKKDQRRWLDASVSPTHRSRRRLYSDDMDAEDLEYDKYLRSCAEADEAQEINEQPESGLSLESEIGGASALLPSAPGLHSVHAMWQSDDCKESTTPSSLNAEGDDTDYQSERQQGTEQSTDAARANLPVALKLWAHRSTRRARAGKRNTGPRGGISGGIRQSRASRTSGTVDRFADFRFTFDCNTTTHRQAEDVDYFSDFRSIFNHSADADHAAEVVDYFADFRSAFEDRSRSNNLVDDYDFIVDFGPGFDNGRYGRTVEAVDHFTHSRWIFDLVPSIEGEAELPEEVFADFRHAFEERPGTNRAAEAVDFFADFRGFFDSPARGRTVEPINHFAQSTWIFGRNPRTEGEDEMPADHFADFRHTFDDTTRSNHVAEVADYFADFRKFVDVGPRYHRAAEPVHYFAQSRWIFGRVANINGEDRLLADYFTDSRHAFEDNFGTNRMAEVLDYFSQSRSFLDGSWRCGRAADPMHYFAQSRWMFDCNDSEDELPMDYFADFKSVFDSSTDAEGHDYFTEFWSIFDDALEDIDYFSEFRSIFDRSIDVEEDDELSIDASVASVADSPPPIPRTPKLPRITCFFNRYSPLRRIGSANIDIESDISQEDHRETVALLQELPNLSPIDYHSARFHVSSWSSPSSSSQPHRRNSQHKHDSGCYSASDPFDADADPAPPHQSAHHAPPPQDPHRLITPPSNHLTYRKPCNHPSHSRSRSTSPSSAAEPPHSRATSTFTSSRLPSSTLEIVLENDDVDPRLRREQALLWSLLGTRDERLAREERKRVWEVMRVEAGSRVVSGLEGLELRGEDFGFGEESEGETAVESEAVTVVEEEC